MVERAYRAVADRLLGRTLRDKFEFGTRAQVFKIGHEQGRQMLAPVADDAGLRNRRIRIQPLLEVRWRHVLAAGKHDNLFLAVGYSDVAVIVDARDVAGMEPSLAIEGLAGFLFELVIARHHVGTANQQFAVRRGAYFDLEEGASDRAYPRAAVKID